MDMAGVSSEQISYVECHATATHVGDAIELQGLSEAFRATAESLRGLTPAERASIEVRRIRIARARAGETLAALSRRTGNDWSVAETASANAIQEGRRLSGGRAIKIAVDEPLAR